MAELGQAEDEATHQLYWLLVGGLAWLLQARADTSPFICDLQRVAQKPLIRHVCRNNRVLRCCRRVPSGMQFQQLQAPVRLVVCADAAYTAKPGGTSVSGPKRL